MADNEEHLASKDTVSSTITSTEEVEEPTASTSKGATNGYNRTMSSLEVEYVDVESTIDEGVEADSNSNDWQMTRQSLIYPDSDTLRYILNSKEGQCDDSDDDIYIL